MKQHGADKRRVQSGHRNGLLRAPEWTSAGILAAAEPSSPGYSGSAADLGNSEERTP